MFSIFKIVRFHLLRLYISIVVEFKNLIKVPWKKVEGIYLPLNRDIGFNTSRWIVNGRYETGEFNIVKKHLQKGDIVLEIGTGLGFISSYCAKIVGSESVYTFEANPVNVELAKQVYFKNAVNPVLKNAILADENGFADFYIDKKNLLASALGIVNGNKIKVEKLNLNEQI